jgi:hypothetical protein
MTTVSRPSMRMLRLGIRVAWLAAITLSSVLLDFVLVQWGRSLHPLGFNNQGVVGSHYAWFCNGGRGTLSAGAAWCDGPGWFDSDRTLRIGNLNRRTISDLGGIIFGRTDCLLTDDGATARASQVEIQAKAWRLALASAILPGLVGVRTVQRKLEARRRSREGCCKQCGYDLRGSIESERCPECGLTFAAAAVAAAATTGPAASGTRPPADLPCS